MLGTPRARMNGPAFAAGWVLALATVGAVVLALANGSADNDAGEPATWASVLKLVFGALFILLAVRTWRRRPAPGREGDLPPWMRTIDAFGPAKAFGAGALLAGVNPKNLALGFAAATAIAESGLSGGQAAG